MSSLRVAGFRTGLILLLALLSAAPAAAQVGGPPTPPTTLWNFLGIPQGIRKLQGATRNRNGNRPNREPKPPLKAIADPANLESKDPSIKKAAEIKQAEDLKKQKIKAVKYLASIGCGCYDADGGVTAALVASMSDCTEDVRYETIKAITEAAQEGCCANCGSTCCCNKDILTAFAKIAYERDDTGCYLEPSERVRQAAAEGLRACCPNDSPPVIVEPQAEDPIRREGGDAEEIAPPVEGGPPAEPLPPTPPADSAAIEPLRANNAATSAPINSGARIAPPGFGLGVVVDVSPQHSLALVHFDQPELVSPVGSEIGVYSQNGGERKLVARLEIVETFPGSAHVTGTIEALAAVTRGDMVLRPTGEVESPAVATASVETAPVVSAPAPVVPSAPIGVPVVEIAEPAAPPESETAWIEPLPPVESTPIAAPQVVEPQVVVSSPIVASEPVVVSEPAVVSEPVVASQPVAAPPAVTAQPVATPTTVAPALQAPVRSAANGQAPVRRPVVAPRRATVTTAAPAAPAATAAPAQVQQASSTRPIGQPARQVTPAVARPRATAVFMP
jgi:hypothetical protein